jgi:peroxiredoxin
MGAKLNSGDPFPRLSVKLVDGGTLEVPSGLQGRYNIVLFYRGHW